MDISIIDMILTSVFISIPLEFILVYISLIFLKEYDFLYKENLKGGFIKIGLFVICPYIVFSIITFYLDIDVNLRLIMNSIVQGFFTYSMLGYFWRNDNAKKYVVNIIKVYICSLVSLSILAILEILIIMVPQYIFGFDMLILKTTPLTNFIFEIPVIMTIFFIVYMNYVNINISDSLVLKMVWKGKKFFKKFIFIQIIFNILLLIIIFDKFIRNEFLVSLEQDIRTFIVFLVSTIIIIGNLIPWYIIYTLKLKQGKALKKDLS